MKNTIINSEYISNLGTSIRDDCENDEFVQKIKTEKMKLTLLVSNVVSWYVNNNQELSTENRELVNALYNALKFLLGEQYINIFNEIMGYEKLEIEEGNFFTPQLFSNINSSDSDVGYIVMKDQLSLADREDLVSELHGRQLDDLKNLNDDKKFFYYDIISFFNLDVENKPNKDFIIETYQNIYKMYIIARNEEEGIKPVDQSNLDYDGWRLKMFEFIRDFNAFDQAPNS